MKKYFCGNTSWWERRWQHRSGGPATEGWQNQTRPTRITANHCQIEEALPTSFDYERKQYLPTSGGPIKHELNGQALSQIGMR